MAGLYDGIDPQTALLLGLGSGLLGTVGQGRRASFGEAMANGMQAGTAGYRQAIGDRQRAEQLALEQKAREQQMQQAREQMVLAQNQDARAQAQHKQAMDEYARQQEIQSLGAQFMRSPEQRAMAAFGGPTNAAAAAAPSLSPEMDVKGLTAALLAKDWQKGMAFQSALKSANAPITLADNQRLVDPVTKQVILGSEGAPSAEMKRYNELGKLMPWLSHEQKLQLSYDTINTVTPADGGTATTSKFAMVGALPGGQRPAAPMIGQGSPSPQQGMPSPYQTPPPAPGQIGGNPGSKPMERLNTDVKDFAATLEKSNIPQLESALTRVEMALAKYKKTGPDGKPAMDDIPGYGLTGMLPNAVLSDDGKAIRMAIAPLANITIKDRSGAAVTNPEMQRFQTELGSGAFMTDADIMRGIANMRALVDSTKANHMAGAHPEVIAEYNKRYGANTQMPLGGGPSPNVQPGGQVTAPKAPPTGRLKTITSAQVDAIVRDAFAMGKTRAEVLQRLQDEGYAIPMR